MTENLHRLQLKEDRAWRCLAMVECYQEHAFQALSVIERFITFNKIQTRPYTYVPRTLRASYINESLSHTFHSDTLVSVDSARWWQENLTQWLECAHQIRAAHHAYEMSCRRIDVLEQFFVAMTQVGLESVTFDYSRSRIVSGCPLGSDGLHNISIVAANDTWRKLPLSEKKIITDDVMRPEAGTISLESIRLRVAGEMYAAKRALSTVSAYGGRASLRARSLGLLNATELFALEGQET